MTSATAVQDAIAARRSGGCVELPEGDVEVWEPIEVGPDDIALCGRPNGTILQAMVPGMKVIVCARGSHTRSGFRLRDVTIRSAVPETTGVYISNGESVVVEHVRFQGLARNVHLDGGIGYQLLHLISETSWPNPAGVLLVEASQPGAYCQYVKIVGYQSHGPAYSAPLILHRATNVTASHLGIHEPGTDAILIDDDSQGITVVDSTIVKPTNGVTVMARHGAAPLVVALTNVDVDQATGFGYQLVAGNHVRCRGGAVSYGWQGAYIGEGIGNVSLAGLDILSHQHNGIVAGSNASDWTVEGCRVTGNGGAGVVISPGVSNGWRVVGNRLGGNAVPFANLSAGSGRYEGNDGG